MRSLHRNLLAIVALGLPLVATPAAATVLTLSVASGGIDAERTCTSVSCSGVVWTMPGGSLAPGTVFPASGTMTLDTVALTMTVSLSVVSSSIDGAVDNGVTGVQLSNTTYSATVPVVVSGPVGGLTSYVIAAGQTATVNPALLTLVGSGSSDPLFAAVRVTGQCGLLADQTGQCGFTFGRVGFQLPAPLGRHLEQTMNVGVTPVPEPGTALLVAAGLLGFAAARRRS